MLQVLTTILPLFVIIAFGVVIARTPLANGTLGRSLNRYAYYLGLPALIFSALSKLDFSFAEQGMLVLVNSAFLLSAFVLGLLFCKFAGFHAMMTRTIVITVGFANVGYIGIPVLTRLLGEGATGTAAILVAVYIFWSSTIGIGYLEYSLHKRAGIHFLGILARMVRNPLLISAFLGVAAGLSSLKLPSLLTEPLAMISASVTPVILIVIGLFIGKMEFGKLKDWGLSLGYTLIRLLVMPLFLVGLLYLFGQNPGAFQASVLDAAMPFAIAPFALAPLYHLDQPFIARNIALSTVLSVLTLPLWMTVV